MISGFVSASQTFDVGAWMVMVALATNVFFIRLYRK
jgi:hypothetical protein